MGQTIKAQAPAEAELGIKVTKADGSVEHVIADIVEEDVKAMFAIVQLHCTICDNTWLEDSEQFDSREYIYCPNCGNKEEA